MTEPYKPKVKLALEPEWEAKFEKEAWRGKLLPPTLRPNSYGFRPGRSAHDAIETIFASLKIPKYVLDADISQCFDKINHGVLLVDTPRSFETGILGSTRPLKLGFLRYLAQRWDSQASECGEASPQNVAPQALTSRMPSGSCIAANPV